MAQGSISSADVEAFRRVGRTLATRPALRSAICKGLGETLQPLAASLPAIDWRRVTLGLDGIAVDHRPSEHGPPTAAQVTNLLCGSAQDVFADPDHLEYLSLAIVRVRLRLDAAVHDGFRRRVEATLARAGVRLPGAVGRLLTIALREDAEAMGSTTTRRHARRLALPAARGVVHVAPGIFTCRLFSKRECAAIVAAMHRKRSWEPANVIDYQDLLGERRNADKIRRQADSLRASTAEPLAAAFRDRASRRILPVLERMWRAGIREIREAHAARYRPGDFFSAHTDHGIKTRDRQFSIVCYLDHDFTGGLTAFPPLRTYVRPAAGLAVVFPAEYLHASTPIASGIKHIFVGFAARDAIHASAAPPLS